MMTLVALFLSVALGTASDLKQLHERLNTTLRPRFGGGRCAGFPNRLNTATKYDGHA